MNSRYDQIRDFVEEKMRYDDVVCIWNEFCDRQRWYEDRIEWTSSLDEIFYGVKPSAILWLDVSEFSLYDHYFIKSMDSLVSSDDPFDLISDLSVMVDQIDEDDDDLGSQELRDFLDDLEDEEEEEEEADEI